MCTQSRLPLVRTLRFVLTFQALIAVLALVAAAGDDAREKVIRKSVQATLVQVEAVGTAGVAADEIAVRKLARMGVAAIPVLFDSLQLGRMPLASTAGGRPSGLDDRQRGVVLAAIGRHGRERLRPLLQRFLIADSGRETRVAVLRVLGEAGIATDLEYAVGVAAPGGRLQSGTVRQALTQAIERILRRDRSAFLAVERILFASRPAAAGAFVRAIGSAGGAEEMALLLRLLNSSPNHDTIALASIGQIGQRIRHPLDAKIAERVREFLDADDPQLVREAALACGNLEDYGALETLIERLEHEDEAVKLVAHWALCKITGLSFGAGPDPWSEWLRAETEWFEIGAPPLIEALEESDPARVAAALSALSVRRYRRDHYVAAIAGVLEHDDPAIRTLGCQALRQLGSTAGVRLLIDMLEDDDEQVGTHAWLALKALTGKNIPQDPDAWRAADQSDHGARFATLR